MLPLPFRQEPWTLQSASADQPNPPNISQIHPEAKEAYDLLNTKLSPSEAINKSPNNLFLARAIDQQAPKALKQSVPRWWTKPSRLKVAFILPGELRCLERSRSLIQAIKKCGDLFICTSNAYEADAIDLKPTDISVIENNALLKSTENNLPVSSMRQWHKFAICCQLIIKNELRQGHQYTHLIKLRSDYFYLQPQSMIKDLLILEKFPQRGLIGSSDKVFAGPRHLMLLMQGFWKALCGHFLDRSANDWPINLDPILIGDESAKWYGLGFPERLVGRPKTVAELRETLILGGPSLSEALSQPWKPDEPLINFFQGHPRFPSEVAFARFLNFNGIPMSTTPSLRGFLYSNRNK